MKVGRSSLTISLVLFWAQILVLSLMVVFGATYAIGLFLDIPSAVAFVYPVALQLVLVFRIMVYLGIGFVIVLGYYRRLTRRKKQVDQGLKDRVLILVSQTQQRMKIKKPARILIVATSTSAANAGRNRILVGERLIQQMDDQELVGIIGHELAHGIQHHVLVKALLFPAVLFIGLILYLVAGSTSSGTILVWSAFAGIIFAEIPLSWKMEYSADHRSAELLGKTPMVRALAHLRETHYEGPSFTHPSLASRIKRLEGDHSLPETVIVQALPPQAPPYIGGASAATQLTTEKAKPVEFPKYVYEAAKPRICPICGVQVQAGKTHCWACGTNLRQ